ncbi:MAG: SurA N-terminal domain-containing protein, partial [Pirellulales bacterium]|nr:SurA N-terminal domain-containing protein [Pirellulales bacterium]
MGNVAATVNAQTITRQQLANECLRRYGPEVLEELINKHVLLQACQQRNLIITEKQVDAAITRFAARFGLPTSQWLNVMKERRNMTPDQYRRDVIWP